MRGYAVIDNFFEKKHLDYLRDLALSESYVNLRYPNGYLASDFNQYNQPLFYESIINFICKKIFFLQRKKYDRSWSFVYDAICEGVQSHADPSSYNLNIWVTPDECIADPKKNGIRIYNKNSKGMTWNQYNTDRNLIKNFLKDSKYTVVPYKFNRAVIFPGSTFHATDKVHMKSGKENRRINYTFLFK